MKKYLLLFLVSLGALYSCQQKEQKVSSPYHGQIDTLISKMTLEEKIGQMTQMCFSTITLDGSKSLDLNVDNFRDAITKHHVGSFLSGSDSAAKWVKFITQIQKVAVEETRLGIPLIIGIDHVHGANYVNEGTIFPHNLMASCSFNPELMKKMARVTAIETGFLGLSWNFAPVLDVGKNKYWPRLYETFGEDPYLCGVMGTAFIKQYQDCEAIKPYKLAACAKHFIGYSDPKYGFDRAPAQIPKQVMWEHFVPPFKMALNNDVKTVMVNSGAVNGIPVHASEELLNGMLREKLGFEGVILTDIKDIHKIVEMHKAAHDVKEATWMALQAGIDMYMACNSFEFCQVMKELVEEGKITEQRINESVRRILQLKYDLGLFENPYPTDKYLDTIGCEEHLAIAKEAALKSMVLLKNNDLLPLTGEHKIFLSGLGADSKKILNGAWTYEWLGAEEIRQPDSMKTLYDALSERYGEDNIQLFAAQGIVDDKAEELIADKIDDSDLVIITAGEEPYSEFKGNITNLQLEKAQKNLIKAAAGTGKKVILVLFEGRPRLITDVVRYADAVIFAGYPGIMGGVALAELISGKENFTGKLSFSYPNEPGHCIPYYYKSSEFNIYWKKYTQRKFLYPFGHGLSYTGYEYSDLELSDTVFTDPGQEITASVEVKNIGGRAGEETVLWFIHDEVGRIIRPVKQLKYFEKVFLPAGIAKTVNFSFKPADIFKYPDKNGDMILEKGQFKIIVDELEAGLRYE